MSKYMLELKKELKTDKAFYDAWKANIKMCFVDEITAHYNKTKREKLTRGDVQKISDAAAERFLNILTEAF